jgi:hypothetical protein
VGRFVIEDAGKSARAWGVQHLRRRPGRADLAQSLNCADAMKLPG